MTDQPTIHLCIATGQPLANLIPILQYRPQRVALCVSSTMRGEGEKFRRLLESLDYGKDKVNVFDDLPDNGIEQIRETALRIESELQSRFPGHRIAYNATGGTKLMALGFTELLGGGDNQVFYTDTAAGRIEYIIPSHRPTDPMPSVLNIDVCLRAHGKQPRRAASDDEQWRGRAEKRKALSKWLAENAAALDAFFGAINDKAQNALAASARGRPSCIVQPQQSFSTTPKGIWREALQKINQVGLCQWDESRPETLYFDKPEGAEYLAGRWLEEYVWHVVQDERPDDAKAGVEFTDMAHARNDVRNELDCIAAHRNRLLLIECKTGRLEDKGADVVYKLDSIGNDVGLFQKRLLVSARRVDNRTRARANEEGIEVLEAEGLKTLRSNVRDWMEGRR